MATTKTTTTNLRIVCLLPSATEICVALGLHDYIVGVTHECVLPTSKDDDDTTSNNNHSKVHIVTRSGIAADASQAEINQQVTHAASCSSSEATTPPSLYPIIQDEFWAAKPTLVITQDLCHVCAPSTKEIHALQEKQKGADTKSSSVSSSSSLFDILSLAPQSLDEVAETFVTIASACGVPERGHQLRTTFFDQLQQIPSTLQIIQNNNHPPPTTTNTPRRSVAILEWLDPPYDAGHWMLDMMSWVGATPALPAKATRKSQAISWSDLQQAQPDVVIIACCGFDLQRNVRDARDQQSSSNDLQSVQARNYYAVDAQRYFVSPSPNLVLGTVLVALCMYPERALDLLELPFVQGKDLEHAYQSIVFDNNTPKTEEPIPDIEDFYTLHEQACANNRKTYIDPATGYSVFTQVAHLARGKCCGSGCRHCPYNHENIRHPEQRLARIQQPSLLVHGTRYANPEWPTKVVFFSGGKDSFLTIRALIRQFRKEQQQPSSQHETHSLVLLTTFDAHTRQIAHQDVSLEIVLRQATHLGLTLLGVPLHRSSSESYVSRIQRALQALERTGYTQIESLVFGDLHLEHILQWRNDQLGQKLLGYSGSSLEYPLLHKDYQELEHDLWASQVPCVVSASTIQQVAVGEAYNREFVERLRRWNQENPSNTIDLFGERGEFHTEVRAWETDPIVALGL